MNEIIFQLHTPEELRYLSNIFHWILGYAFFAVTVITILQLLGYLKSKFFLWPLLIIIVSGSTVLYLMLHHGLSALLLVWKVILSDSQQQQHFTMLILLFLGGISEFLLSLKKLKKPHWYIAWPISLIIIGFMFLFHPQHGTAEAIAYTLPFHTSLGLFLIATGLFKTVYVLLANKFKLLSQLSVIGLLIVSIMLISYSEPEGAYQMSPQNQRVQMMSH